MKRNIKANKFKISKNFSFYSFSCAFGFFVFVLFFGSFPAGTVVGKNNDFTATVKRNFFNFHISGILMKLNSDFIIKNWKC